jgi:hypothetical protein
MVLGAGLLPQPVAARQPEVGGEVALKEAYDKVEGTFNKLLNGSAPSTAADRNAMAVAAKYYAYQLTWVTTRSKPGELAKSVKRFNDEVVQVILSNERKMARFADPFTKEMLAKLKEVIGLGFAKNSDVCLHACLMLQLLAKTGHEDVGDYLAQLLRDGKQHDAVKLYALNGLREFYAKRSPVINDADKRAREARRLDGILEFLNRPSPLTDKASPEEEAAVRFLRAAAVRALAQVRLPALSVQGGKVQTPVAYGLLRTLAEKGGLSPTPGVQERYEAAVGLCQMHTKGFPDYQADPAAFLVGRFLTEFAQRYNEDYAYFGEKVAKGGAKKVPLYPWKAMASNLKESLKELEKNAGPAAARVKGLIKAFEPIAEEIQRSRGTVAIDQLREAVGAAPKTGAVYQGVKGLEVPLQTAE